MLCRRRKAANFARLPQVFILHQRRCRFLAISRKKSPQVGFAQRLIRIQFMIAEQIARRLGDRRQQLAWPVQSPAKFLSETAFGSD